MVKVLFVCMGNICRSPTAEGVFRHMVKQLSAEHEILINSAGTHAYHVGNPPDARAQDAALKRDIDLSNQRVNWHTVRCGHRAKCIPKLILKRHRRAMPLEGYRVFDWSRAHFSLL